ncbi:MAG: DUF4136 domain-containing protein [Desulfobacterales bacterium]|nr:DUF4136 domain-containing protein [Desulfobacterales bacterium]
MNQLKYYFIGVFLLSFIYGCSGIVVSQDYNMSSDFSTLKTYGWQSETQPKTGDIRVDNPLLDNRIRNAIVQVLSLKGFKKADDGAPDFFISYQYAIQNKIKSDNVSTGIGFGIGSTGSVGGIGISSGSDVRAYDQGMLVIDITDPEKELLWRGKGTLQVTDHSNPEKTTKTVNAVVEKTLRQFPPL